MADLPGEAHVRPFDVTDEERWKSTLASVIESFGSVDVLVNNAGLPYRRMLEDSPLDEWQKLMHVNAGGAFLGLKHGTQVIADSGGGAIVNISSAAALAGVAGMTSYSASKGAIRAMSRVASREYAEQGVRVNSVFPTSVATAMLEFDAADTGVSVPEFAEVAASLSPLDGLAEPEDVANAALFPASDESKFITGAELLIDGGASSSVG